MWTCPKCSEEHDDSFDICWNCGTTTEGVEDQNFQGILEQLLFTTTSNIETHTIRKYVGVVCGEAILGANIVSDFVSGVTDVLGGRSGTYESYIQEARLIAQREVAQKALSLHANAVIGLKFDYETIRGSMLMVACSGTAVIVEEKVAIE